MNIKLINPFTIKHSNDELSLIISGDVNDSQWYLFFGSVQEKINELEFNKFSLIIMDSRYISDKFLMSLTLQLKYKNINHLQIFNSKFEDRTINNFQQNDLFLFEYLKDYFKINDINNDDSIIILPATFCDLNSVQNINEYVEDLLQQLNNLNVVINDRIKEDEFKIKLQNILVELTDNSLKYAYNDFEHCFAGIKIDYCKTEIKDWQNRNKIDNKRFSDEVFLSPKIIINYVDLGTGIVNSYKKRYNFKTISKRPLREITKRAYFYNNINDFRNGRTNICGLQYIGKMLENDNNYITIYSDGEAIGTYLKNDDAVNLHSAFLISDYNIEKPLMGLTYSIYIETSSKKTFEWNKQNVLSYNTVFNNLTKLKNIQINVKDFRNIFKKYTMNGEINEKCLKGEQVINNNLEILFIFMNRITSKNMVLKLIKKALNVEAKTLIICDVNETELELFEYSLKNTSSNLFSNRINNIYVVTKTLSLIEFKTENFKFRKSINPSFEAFNKKYNYLYNIKYYESFVLTHLQENNSFGQHMITNGEIIWNDAITLKGYINFDILTSSPYIFEFLKFNLIRYISALNFPKLVPLDNMVTRLADEINSEYFLSKKKDILYLGSVYVSGTTYNLNTESNDKTLHFFNRNKTEKMMSVFMTPEKLLTENVSNGKYIRIGKSYKIINVNNINKQINSRCFLSKKETYSLFDSNYYNPFIINHTSFYGSHYLLNFSLEQIYNNKSSKLFDFIRSVILYSLGHYFNISTKYNNYFNELKNSCAIVYLSHHFTDKIVDDQIKNDSQYEKFIIGLNHINLFRQEQCLEFSNVYSEYIKELINNFKVKCPDKEIKFIIFDTIISSGRTRKEIKSYLQSLGATRIIFVSIIDSQEQRYNKSINNYSFMNVPFPRIGTRSSCQICEAIETQKLFMENIISTKMRNTVQEICDNLECRDLIISRSKINNFTIEKFFSKDIVLKESQYYVENDIIINKIVTLYLFISDQIRQLNDFGIFDNFLDSKIFLLDKNSTALFISLFIADFYNQCYVKLKEKTILILLNILGDISNNYIFSLSYILLSKYKSDVINILKKYGLKSFKQSDKANVLLLYLFFYPTGIDNLFIKNEDTRLYLILSNAILGGNYKIDIYKQFHCQLVNVNGDVHNSPLKNLASFSNENNDVDDYYINSGLSSLELLKNSLCSPTIEFDSLYGNSDNKKQEYKKLIEKIEHVLSQDLLNSGFNLRKKANEIFEDAMKIHSYLFLPLGISKDKTTSNTLINRLISIVKDYNDEQDENIVKFMYDYTIPSPTHGAKELYYIFNNILSDEIKYCLDNIKKYYVKNRTAEKYIDAKSNEYFGVLGLDIKEEFITLEITNGLVAPISNVQFKLRYQKEELKNLGVTIKSVNKKDSLYGGYYKSDCFVIHINIPNINFLNKENLE